MMITRRKQLELETLFADVIYDLVTDQIGEEDPAAISDNKLEDIKAQVADLLEGIIDDYIYGFDLDEDLGRNDDE